MTNDALSLPVSLLKEDPDNPREIDDPALAGLAVSVEEFGDLSGIVWNERTGELVCGHQRMKTLRAAGAVKWARNGRWGHIEHPKTGERFPIRIVDWDETKQRMANLVANNSAIQGSFTEDAARQIAELQTELAAEVAALRLDDLRAKLEKDLRAATASAANSAGGAGDQSSEVSDLFAIVIECRNEEQQRELLERFTAEGLPCRALT